MIKMENPIIRMQEQSDDANYKYVEWVSNNEQYLLESYCESLDFEDLPKEYVLELQTDDVELLESAMDKYISKLTFKDVPDSYLEMMYELECDR